MPVDDVHPLMRELVEELQLGGMLRAGSPEEILRMAEPQKPRSRRRTVPPRRGTKALPANVLPFRPRVGVQRVRPFDESWRTIPSQLEALGIVDHETAELLARRIQALDPRPPDTPPVA